MEDWRATVFGALPRNSFCNVAFADIVCDYLVDATSVVPRPYIRAALNDWPTPLADLIDGYACDWLVQIRRPSCAPMVSATDSGSLSNPHECTFATWGADIYFSHCDRSTRVASIRLPVRRSTGVAGQFSKNAGPQSSDFGNAPRFQKPRSSPTPLELVLSPLWHKPALERVVFSLDIEKPVDVQYCAVHLPARVHVVSCGWDVEGDVYS